MSVEKIDALATEAFEFAKAAFDGLGKCAAFLMFAEPGKKIAIWVMPNYGNPGYKGDFDKHLRTMLRNSGATDYIFACEAWFVTGEAARNLDGAVSESPDRYEAIHMVGADRSGNVKGWIAKIDVVDGKRTVLTPEVFGSDMTLAGPTTSFLYDRHLH